VPFHDTLPQEIMGQEAVVGEDYRQLPFAGDSKQVLEMGDNRADFLRQNRRGFQVNVTLKHVYHYYSRLHVMSFAP
jgi:hypothetical protein